MISLLDNHIYMVYNIKCGKKVFTVEKINVLTSIKDEIESHVGERVTLKANGGRRKILVDNGVIEKTYTSIFVIRLENDTHRTLTYSYSDVLTKTVQIVFAG